MFPHGFFLGLGLGLWFKAGLPELTYCRARHLLRCPPMPGALPFNILICLAFAAIQAGVYHFRFDVFLAVQRSPGVRTGPFQRPVMGAGTVHAPGYPDAGAAGL